MSQYTVNLQAGAQTRIEVSGVFFMVRSVDTLGATLDVTIEVRGDGDRNDERFSAVEAGFKAKISRNRFDAVVLTASANCSVVYVISRNEVDFDFFAGASVNATIVAPNPLPVQNDRGTPGNLMFVSGVSIADAPATSSPDNAAVAVGAVATAILAADATRRQIVFTNIGVDDCALGALGITWAKRCVIIKSGDSYVEDRAANLAWYGICDAAKTASITTKTVIA